MKLWLAQSGQARSASGWSTCPSSCTRRPRRSRSASTSSRARPALGSARSGSIRRPTRRSPTRRSSRATRSRPIATCVIEPEELDALDPKATKTIDIEEFVDLDEIDPIYYDHSYYLAPTAGGAKAYRLLLDAMRESGKVGIGRVVLRSKQQLCALRPTGDVLTLTTMLWGDEVLSPDRLDELESVDETEATDRELKMAEQLIDSLSGEFEPDEVPRRVSRAGARPDRAQGRRRGDRGPAAGRGARRGARPDGRARGEPRGGPRRQEDGAREEARRQEGADAGQARAGAAAAVARPSRNSRKPQGRQSARRGVRALMRPPFRWYPLRSVACRTVLRFRDLLYMDHRFSSTRGHRPLRPRKRARCVRHRARREAVGRGQPRRRREGARRAREPRASRRRGRRPEHRRRRRHPAPDPGRVPEGRGRRRRAAAARALRRRRLLPADRRRAPGGARAADRGDDRGRGAARDLVARRARSTTATSARPRGCRRR